MTGRDKINQEAQEALRKNNYTGVLLASTGVGKARIMIEAAKNIETSNILYLCDNEELRDKTFKAELYKWDASYLIPKMEFACYQTAYKWSGRHYNLLLADEFDFSLTPQYSQVYFNNIFDYKILVSATLDEEKKVLAKKIAPIIYEKNQKELIEENVLNNIQPFFINYDLLPHENKKYLNYNESFSRLLNAPSSSSNLKQLSFLKIHRKQFLSSLKSSEIATRWLLQTLSSSGDKTLVFCGLSTQADNIHKNSYHSINNNKEALLKFDNGDEDVLTVVEKITRGVNVNGVKNVIHEAPSRSKTRITQKTGRGMRLHFNDTLNLFFMIPYFRHPRYGRRPTVVQDWVDYSTTGIDMSNLKVINYNT